MSRIRQVLERAGTRLWRRRLRAVGLRDARRLRAEGWHLEACKAAADEIRGTYEDYVTTVSTAGMAASLETSAVLLWLCRESQATRVMDLGSGFSSWVLRYYAQGSAEDVEVLSVDDSPAWLDKTREFLRRHGQPDDGLVEYADLRAAPGSFGVVFHDIAGGDVRDAAMAHAFDLTVPGGFVLIDDVHNSSHRRHARGNAEATGADLWSLRPFTLDRYGRFAMLARKPSERSCW